MYPNQPQPSPSFMTHMARIVEMNERMVGGMIELQAGMQSLTAISLNQSHNLEKLLTIATQHQDNLQQFVLVLKDQAFTINELSRSLRESLESSRQLARTIDNSTALAKANQVTIKALLEELKQAKFN